MNTPLLLRRALLRLLEAYSPHSAPVNVLLEGINTEAPRPLNEADLAEHLGWLKDQRLADVLNDPLDPASARWVITKTGLAALRQ